MSGNTRLHEAVLACKRIEEIKAFMCTLDQKQLQRMARTINDDGLLPYQLVNQSQLIEKEKKLLLAVLLKTATAHQYKPIKQPLSQTQFNKIVEKYNVLPNTPLFKNLQIAFVIINDVLRLIDASATRPEMNNETVQTRVLLSQQIKQMRKQKWQRVFALKNLFQFYKSPYETVMAIEAEMVLNSKIGNCREYAALAFVLLKQIDPTLQVERWHIKNGDHIYLVIGKGEDRVVCDPWSGKFYPFYAIESKLKSHVEYAMEDAYLNICVFFNSNYFKAEPHALSHDLSAISRAVLSY